MHQRYILIFLLIISVQTGLLAQDAKLSGYVRNSAGEALAFANIQLIGTQTGTISREDGYFSLLVPPGNYWLQISMVGYQTDRRFIPLSDSLVQIAVVLAELNQELNSVVVSATRTERNIADVPIPVSIVSGEQIRQMGALRLNEVLQEQTGLQIVSNHGTGLQVQGLSSDYVMIMIDGEPIIGRTSGTLDLSRLTVNNIERIEIIKGPSSSLYGSEAMAGIINIITRRENQAFSASLRSRYRSFNTLDLNADAGMSGKKASIHASLNRLSTDGYDLSPESISQTAPPFTAYTYSLRTDYALTSKMTVRLNARYFTEKQHNVSEVASQPQAIVLAERGARTDWNLMPVLTYQLSPTHKLLLKNYTSQYHTETRLTTQTDGALYDESVFTQLFNRTEAQWDAHLNPVHTLTAGAGWITERVQASRYDAVNQFQSYYGFGQYQWMPSKQLNVVAGARFDGHSAYANRFSPKVAVQFTPISWLALRASVGSGYKAPDLRQLVLNFTNPVAGYSVFGANLVREGVSRLQQEGQIDAILIDPATVKELQAESSVAYNLGFTICPEKAFRLTANLFRNNIHNLIETAPVARKTNGQSVFTYFNVSRVFTQGAEVEVNYAIRNNLRLSLGYQYLDAQDVDIRQQIRQGKVFRRDARNEVTRTQLSDYGGLFNRSRHSGNVKLLYAIPKYDFQLSVRGIYRGRFGFGDVNGNLILDDKREYAHGYFLWNIAATKTLRKQITLEAGVNNLLNRTNTYEPSLAGRLLYVGLAWQFAKEKASDTEPDK